MAVTKAVEIPRLLLQALVDMAVESMDWGSGFLDTEDVDHLRAAAGILGVNPRNVTPSDFRDKYLDPLSENEFVTLESYRQGAEKYRDRNGQPSRWYVDAITAFEKRMAANGQTEPVDA